jgi:hypothetical protein
MLELVAVESDGAEMVDFGADTMAQRIEWEEWIMDQNEVRVQEGYDATDYRIVDADTRNCPSHRHSATEHASQCLAAGWAWENLGQ